MTAINFRGDYTWTLCPFVDYPREPMPQGLPYRLSDYLELLDWTGRIIRDDKRGAIRGKTPKVLGRLNIEAKNWLHSAQCTVHSTLNAHSSYLQNKWHPSKQPVRP